jgi:hypothetical protein
MSERAWALLKQSAVSAGISDIGSEAVLINFEKIRIRLCQITLYA